MDLEEIWECTSLPDSLRSVYELCELSHLNVEIDGIKSPGWSNSGNDIVGRGKCNGG